MSLKYSSTDEEDEDDAAVFGLIHQAKETALKPFRIATSRPALRAYLTTILLILASLVLLGSAIAAYTLFYWNYIPRIGFERTVHLQFDNVFPASSSRFDEAANPYGTVELGGEVVSEQRYDIRVVLELPRTRENRETGNFMLEAGLYASGVGILDGVKEGLAPGLAEKDNRLAFSRRPAMLQYRSLPLEWITRTLQLPWYLLGWRSESEALTVGLWEGAEFERGWRNVPANMRIEIQSAGRMQLYSAKVEWRARFRGLRWVMYNHRIISAVVFITLFWTTEMAFAGFAWAVASFYLSSPPPEQGIKPEGDVDKKIKQEPTSDEGSKRLEMSDTERTFPSSSKQQPLRYQSPKEEDEAPPRIKQEGEDAPTKATEADDEDEDEDVDFVDSGLGTSMESSAARRDSVRRRRGRGEKDEG